MSSEYSGNGDSYPATITLPSGGNARSALSVNDGLSDLADRTEYLRTQGSSLDGARNWRVSDADLPSFTEGRGGDYSTTHGIWIVVGSTDLACISYDDGYTWHANVSGMASSVALQDVAIDQNSNVAVAVSVATANTGYRQTDLFGGAWSSVTLTGLASGATAGASSIVWDSSNDTFIVVGWEASGANPYVATSSDAGATFTERTAPGGFPGLGGLAVSGSGIAVAGTVAGSPHTKLMFSTNGGVTWAASTTTLTSACYDIAYSQDRGQFLAAPNASGPHYTSTDGNTWTQVFTGDPAGVRFATNAIHHGLVAYGGAWLRLGYIQAETTARAVVAISFDGGVTWERTRLAFGSGSAGPRAIFSDAAGHKAIASFDSSAARLTGCWRRGSM